MKKDVKSCFQFIDTFFLLDLSGNVIVFFLRKIGLKLFRLLKISCLYCTYKLTLFHILVFNIKQMASYNVSNSILSQPETFNRLPRTKTGESNETASPRKEGRGTNWI